MNTNQNKVPQFDSSRPFQAVQSVPVFDPNKPFVEKEPAIDGGSGAEAALQGFGKTATLGYLPQIQAITQPISDRLLNILPGEDVSPAPFKQMIPGSPEYLQARDANIQRQKMLEKNNPVASSVGQIGGALTSALIPMGALARGGSVGKAALSGGIIGAAQNPGDKQGDVNPFQLKDRLKGALSGAAVGGIAQGAIGGIGGAINKARGLPEKLDDISDAMAFRSLGGFKADIKRVSGRDSLDEYGHSLKSIGKFAKEKGLVRGGDDIFDVAERAGKFQKETGQKIGQIYEDIAQKYSNPAFLNDLQKSQRLEAIKTNFRPKQMAQEFLDEATAKWTGKRGGQAALKRVQSEVEDLMQNKGLMGIQQVHQFRKDLDKTIRFEKDEPVQQGLRDFRNFLNKKIEKRINFLDKVEGSEKTKALKAANLDYSKISTASDIIKNRLQSEYGNNIFSLTDKLFMGEGAGIGAMQGMISGNIGDTIKGGLLGLLGGVASKAARRHAAPALMSGTEKLGSALSPLGLLPAVPNVDPRLVGGSAPQIYETLKGNKNVRPKK